MKSNRNNYNYNSISIVIIKLTLYLAHVPLVLRAEVHAPLNVLRRATHARDPRMEGHT